jgi:hypothetical protein
LPLTEVLDDCVILFASCMARLCNLPMDEAEADYLIT